MSNKVFKPIILAVTFLLFIGMAFNVFGEAPAYTHNGVKFFPVIYWHNVDPATQGTFLDELKAGGFNVITVWYSWATPANLNILNSKGLKCRNNIHNQLRDVNPTILASWVEPIRTHTALFDYLTGDEPCWSYALNPSTATTLAEFTEGKNQLRLLDSTHDLTLNYADHWLTIDCSGLCSVAGYQAWRAAGTSYSMDIYPVTAAYPNSNLNRIGNGCNFMKTYIDNTKPFTMILQAYDAQSGVYPTKTELRFMVFTSIINGAKGIGWYGYPAQLESTHMDVWTNVKAINNEVKALSSALSNGTTNTAYTLNTPGLEAISKTYGAYKYLIVANRTATTKTNASITVSGWSSNVIQELDPDTSTKLIYASGGNFTDDFAPWEVHIYKSCKPAEMVSPLPNSTLTASSQLFTWNAGIGVQRYAVNVGTVPREDDLYDESSHLNLSSTAIGLPTDGRTLYVSVISKINDGWHFQEYTYTAATPTAAAMISPVPGSVLPGSTVTFVWNAGSCATRYGIKVGTTFRGTEIYTESSHTNLSRTVSGIPTDGRVIYVSLVSKMEDGTWRWRDYQYTAN